MKNGDRKMHTHIYRCILTGFNGISIVKAWAMRFSDGNSRTPLQNAEVKTLFSNQTYLNSRPLSVAFRLLLTA